MIRLEAGSLAGDWALSEGATHSELFMLSCLAPILFKSISDILPSMTLLPSTYGELELNSSMLSSGKGPTSFFLNGDRTDSS